MGHPIGANSPWYTSKWFTVQSSAQDMSGKGDHRHSRWAEEVDQEEAQGQAESGVYDEVSGQYRNSNASWDAGMEVERGQSRHRLDLSHGFMRNIVRMPSSPRRAPATWHPPH